LVDSKNLCVLAECYQRGLLPKQLLADIITGTDKHFPQNIQFIGEIYKKDPSGGLRNKLHDEHNVQSMYENMLLERTKRDGRNGNIKFIDFLKSCGVYDEWVLRKDVIPNSAIHRMMLTETLKTVLEGVFKQSDESVADRSQIAIETAIFDELIEKVLSKNVSAKITMLCLCEGMTTKVDETEQGNMDKPIEYQLLKNVSDSLLSHEKLLNFLRSNQLEALYGCQMFVDELGHPFKLLMAIFNHLYSNDIVDVKTYKVWVEDDEEICSGKKKALFSVNAWLNVISED